MPWDDTKSNFRGFNFPCWLKLVEMVFLRVGQENKVHEQSFFLAKECISGVKNVKKKIWETPFFQDTPWECAALLFQYTLAHVYIGVHMFFSFLLFHPKFEKADFWSFKGWTEKESARAVIF